MRARGRWPLHHGIGPDERHANAWSVRPGFRHNGRPRRRLRRDARRSGNWTGGRIGSGELRGTKFGISAAAYPAFDIQNLTIDGAKSIYRRDYWARVRGDDLPAHLAILVFDAAVNNGVVTASRWLQLAVGAGADGIVGDETIEAAAHAVGSAGISGVAAEFMARRLAFMAALPSWTEFGLGWARRLCALPYEAMAVSAT